MILQNSGYSAVPESSYWTVLWGGGGNRVSNQSEMFVSNCLAAVLLGCCSSVRKLQKRDCCHLFNQALWLGLIIHMAKHKPTYVLVLKQDVSSLRKWMLCGIHDFWNPYNSALSQFYVNQFDIILKATGQTLLSSRPYNLTKAMGVVVWVRTSRDFRLEPFISEKFFKANHGVGCVTGHSPLRGQSVWCHCKSIPRKGSSGLCFFFSLLRD